MHVLMKTLLTGNSIMEIIMPSFSGVKGYVVPEKFG